jgi:outer membrane protein
MTKRLKKVIGIAILLWSGGASSQVPKLALADALNLALKGNYSLKSDTFNIVATHHRNRELAGYYLPQVNISNQLNHNIAVPTQMLPGAIAGQPSKDYVPIQFGTKYDAGTSVEVNQVILRKDLMLKIRAANLYTDIATTRHALTREEIIYKTTSMWYALQSTAELIRNTKSDYDNMATMKRIAQAQLENGTLTRIDFQSLAINVANKASELSRLQTQYAEQLDKFKYFIGMPSATIVAIDSLRLTDTHEPEPGKATRNDIRLYNQLLSAKEVDIRSIRAESKPAISTYLRYKYQSQFSTASRVFDRDFWFHSSSIGITATMPIFDGFRRKHRVKTAQAELQQLQVQLEQTTHNARTETKIAGEKLVHYKNQLKVNTENMAMAEKVFESRRALYTEGVTTLIELLDAERELTLARNLYLQAVVDVQTARLDLHQATGTLSTTFLTQQGIQL